MFSLDLELSVSNPLIWLSSLIAFVLCYNYLVKEPWKNLPPGPPVLPVVGSLPFLGLDIREPLRKMAAKYGDVFTVFLGTKRVVVLNGYDVIKEAFVTNERAFSGRPPIYLLRGITDGYGIASSHGSFWSEQRSHVMRVLHDFGFGRPELEERILDEIRLFIPELRKHTNTPIHPQLIIQKSVANTMACITFGKRMNYNNPAFINYLKMMNRSIEVLGNNGVITMFPFLRHLPGDFFRIKQLQKDVDYLNSEYERLIEEHKLAVMYGQESTDFITCYLNKINEEKDKQKTTFTEKQLRGIIMDLFAAGSEGTSTTLTWAIIYMSLNQDIQSRCREEIEAVIGRVEMPRMHHRSALPFVEACIMETQRLADVVPLGIPHAATEDVNFRGFLIPKATMILPNLYSVHMDPARWPEPDQFKPERFLDDEGKIIRREELIPFSIGTRLCLGESLAKMELFLYFSVMIQNFHFRLAPGYPVPDTRGKLALTNIPKPFYVIVESR